MPSGSDELSQLFQGFAWPENLLFTLATTALILLVGLWLSRLLSRWAVRSLDRADVEATMSRFLGQLVYFGLLALVVVLALANFGIPMASIIAVLGAATLAVGLALQDSLSNFASGVLLVVLKPFGVGDSVEIDGKRGTVLEVRLFQTKLRDRDNRDVYLPNNTIMENMIVNFSSSGSLRLDLEYGIAYEADIGRALAIFQAILDEDPRVLEDPAPVVAVKSLGDSSVNFAVRPHVEIQDEVGAAFDITEAVKRRLDEAGISIPFPQRDVHLVAPPGEAGAASG